MKASLRFKGGEFHFRPHFSHIEFDVSGTEGRATGKLTANDCLTLGKYLMDIYYARAMRQQEVSDPGAEPVGE